MKYYHNLNYSIHIRKPYEIFTAYDRTKKILTNQNIEIITPIGEVISNPKTIDELCHDSVSKILNSAQDKKISIFWSGGIDSTLILTEFLKYVPHDRIRVILNQYSYLEYPDFYHKHIENKLEKKKVSFYDNEICQELIKDSVIVTGHLTDTYFGPINYSVIPKEVLEKNITDFLNPLSKKSQETYTQIVSACPRELENVKDLFWWLDYVFHYQNEQVSMLLDNENLFIDQNIFYFSMTKHWNDYSVSTPIENKWKGYDYKDHKMCLKKQIHEYTKDTNYTENKIKVASWRRYRTVDQRREDAIYITTDWKRGWGVSSEKFKIQHRASSSSQTRDGVTP